MKMILNSIILFHYFIFFSLLLTVPLVIMYQPLYMSITLVTMIVRVMTSNSPCPLSMLECHFQEKLGLVSKPFFLKNHILVDLETIKNYMKGLMK